MSIHGSAIVDPEARVDPTTEIGAYSVLEAGVRVGARCRIAAHVFLAGATEIGDDCVIRDGAVVGTAPVGPAEGVSSGCRIGRGTVLGEHVVVEGGSLPDAPTILGEGCVVQPGCQIGHGVAIGDRAVLSDGVVVTGHVRIGSLARIEDHSRIVRDVLPYALVDEHGRIEGVDEEGLRDAGLADRVRPAQDAYALLFDPAHSSEAALAAIGERIEPEVAGTIVAFVRGRSRRGLTTGSWARRGASSRRRRRAVADPGPGPGA